MLKGESKLKRKILCLMVLMSLFAGLALISSGCGGSQPAEKEKGELNLYVAAGLKQPMDVVIEKFKQETGNEVIPNYGPSGGLYTQIKEGQPCDLYYSADWLYIEKLETDQKMVEGKKFLKDNEVLVVSPKGKEKVKSVNDLANKDVVLGVCDPKAPVGVYAEKALKELGLWDKITAAGTIKARPSTVNQLAIMVKTDELDAGLIYSSVAKANELEVIEVIDDKYTGEIIFGAAVIKGGNENLAREFLNFASKHADEFTKYGWVKYE